jgi:hypothetical protein
MPLLEMRNCMRERGGVHGGNEVDLEGVKEEEEEEADEALVRLKKAS